MRHPHLFEVNPAICFAESDIAPIAARQHQKIKPLFEWIVREAACAYAKRRDHEETWGSKPDTLHKVEARAGALLDLLSDNVNQQRLAQVDDASARQVEDLIASLRWLIAAIPTARTLAAVNGVRPGILGRPPDPQRRDLEAAYKKLVDRWIQIFGEAEFKLTDKWVSTDRGLEPDVGATALFLFDALKLIDPERKRLGEQLRDLMAETKKGNGLG